MKKSICTAALSAITLLLATSLSFAATPIVPEAKDAAKATGESAITGVKGSAATAKESAKGVAAEAKAGAKAKLVDINSASEAELKAIPGIGDAYAAKIVGGRPYANKTQLKSRNILPAPAYEKVKDLIIAKQPKK